MDLTKELIHKYLDEDATLPDIVELAHLLATNSAAADLFARMSRFESLLEGHLLEERAISATIAAEEVVDETFSPELVVCSPAVAGRILSRSHLRWRSWMGVAGAALLLVGGAAVLRHYNPAHAAQLRVVSGHVLLDGVEVSQIPEGSRIAVSGNEGAVIRLSEGGEADLSPKTEAVFRGDRSGRVVELESGSGSFQLSAGGNPFRVDTPGGSVVAREGTFSVKIQPTQMQGVEPMSPRLFLMLTVAVMTGQVEVQGVEEKFTLAAGEKREVTTEKRPSLTGKVVEVSADGKQITIEGKPPKPGVEPARNKLQITDQTEVVYFGMTQQGNKPTVGYPVFAWLDKNSPEQATVIEFGVKQPHVQGRVMAVSEDGKQITLEVFRKNEPSEQKIVEISDHTRLGYAGVEKTSDQRPTVGFVASVWLEEGAKTAAEIKFVLKNKGAASTPPGEKPKPVDKTKLGEKPQPTEKPKPEDRPKPTEKTKPVDKPKSEDSPKPVQKPAPAEKTKPTEKPAATEKPKPVDKTKSANDIKPSTAPQKPIKEVPPAEPPRVSTRDPAPITALIDDEVTQALLAAKIPPSPVADDAEFLRRATLDITGRIPSYQQAVAFLTNNEPDKRRKLIDQLLASPEYGQNFGQIWRALIVPRDTSSKKQRVEIFSPWLADQFNRNRGWNQIVFDLLTASGDITRDPQAAFILANCESLEPKPGLLAASTGRLFLGVQLSCAECHNHPFAPWKQTDFWGTAAFFHRVRKKAKGDFSLTEVPVEATESAPATTLSAAITIPDSAGKGVGQVVAAKFLLGATPSLDGKEALRPDFATWATAADNPWFAQAAVNRWWAHFFGQGLVNPVDNFFEGKLASHPVLLQKLTAEFAASDFDLQHLIRCVCNSEAYQRTSQPLAENESDKEWFSHAAIKVMSANVFYDSLHEAMNADPTFVPTVTKGKPFKRKIAELDNRDDFLNFFSPPADVADSSSYNLGIPQLLRLMNAEQFNHATPFAKVLAELDATPQEKIEMAYLATLSRRPTIEEKQLMTEYLTKRQDAEQAFAGVLWILLNTSEFVMVH
jgi:ferric-dicitrate binding protein FerR (iron transport regulator)